LEGGGEEQYYRLKTKIEHASKIAILSRFGRLGRSLAAPVTKTRRKKREEGAASRRKLRQIERLSIRLNKATTGTPTEGRGGGTWMEEGRAAAGLKLAKRGGTVFLVAP